MLIKPIVFLTFSLSSASLDLKVPDNTTPTLAMYQNIKNSYLSAYACAKSLFSRYNKNSYACFCAGVAIKTGLLSQVEMQQVGIVKMLI